MSKKLAFILSLTTFLLVSGLVLFFNGLIVYSSIWNAIKLSVPAAIVAYFGGYYLGKILSSSKTEAQILSGDTQKSFVDDLLLTPSEVLSNQYSKGILPQLDIDTETESSSSEKTNEQQ